MRGPPLLADGRHVAGDRAWGHDGGAEVWGHRGTSRLPELQIGHTSPARGFGGIESAGAQEPEERSALPQRLPVLCLVQTVILLRRVETNVDEPPDNPQYGERPAEGPGSNNGDARPEVPEEVPHAIDGALLVKGTGQDAPTMPPIPWLAKVSSPSSIRDFRMSIIAA